MYFISLEITLAAAVTSVILCAYTYYKDRVEKEPLGLLAILFGVGGILSVPTIYAEKCLGDVIQKLFGNYFEIDPSGFMRFTSVASSVSYYAILSFAVVALLETAVKWSVMFLITHKNKNFNSLFDGLIYGVFVSLGFAMIDNIRFAWMNGWDMLLIRSLTTVPIHMVAGVFMGFFYTMWHSFNLAAKKEKALADEGKITVTKPFRSAAHLAFSIVVPFAVQGIYRFAEYSQMAVSKVFLYVFVIVLFIVGFIGIHQTSVADSLDNKVVATMINKKYPEVNKNS